MSTKRAASAPSNDKGRQKKYHKRNVWACDECRLRKIKCDGNDPCTHCVAIDHACSYEGRSRPPLAPTKRIRLLEEALRNVKSSLVDLQKSGSIGLESTIELLEPHSFTEDKLEKDEATPSSQLPATPHSTLSSPLPAIDVSSTSIFFGPVSGYSVICRLSELFQGSAGLDHRAFQSRQAVNELFHSQDALGTPDQGDTSAALPAPHELLDLYRSCFANHYMLYQVVSETELTELLDDVAKGIYSPAVEPLMHGIAALGLMAKGDTHQVEGCGRVKGFAISHFQSALLQLDLGHCQGLRSLQTALCLVLYLVACCNLTAAHTYSCIACSWMLQLGLHRSTIVATPSGLTASKSREMLLLTLKLHLYLCAILDLPPALQRRQIDPRIWASVQSQYDPETVSDHMDRSSTRFDSPSSCHFLLHEITKEGLDRTFSVATTDMLLSSDELREAVDLGQLGGIESRLQELIERASSSTLRMADKRSQAVAKADLEMTTHFCQMLLYMPFLHHTASMANGTSTSRTRTQRVLACLKVASKTIVLSGSLINEGILDPASWCHIYTLFLAVVTLVFLIAAHRGTTQPSEAWRKAEHGIRILAALRCHDNGAVRCLRVIRTLVDQLSHTVEFDVDKIERETVTVCQSGGAGHSAGVDGVHGLHSPLLGVENGSSMLKPSSSADIMLARANEFVLFGNGD